MKLKSLLRLMEGIDFTVVSATDYSLYSGSMGSRPGPMLPNPEYRELFIADVPDYLLEAKVISIQLSCFGKELYIKVNA